MENKELNCRKNRVGGQAVIEGVMMKRGQDVALAVRKDDGTVEIKKTQFIPLKSKHKWLNIPILRGIVGFVESMILSFKTLGQATDMLGLEDEEPKPKKKKDKKKKSEDNTVKTDTPTTQIDKTEATEGVTTVTDNTVVDNTVTESATTDSTVGDTTVTEAKVTDAEKKEEKKDSGSGAMTAFVMVISLILGLGLAVVLFTVLPSFVADLVSGWVKIENFFLRATIEGVVKILIFIIYLASVSLMKDIRRTFQYHGAEHKSIACYESGMELTPENARKCSRFHPRCGTSFMFVMLLLGIIVGMFIPFWGEMLWLRNIIKILLVPVIMGVGYEFIMFAGKHENWFTKALSAPGLWMQRITTKEPDDYQLAIAICAIKSSMPEEFPDFKPEEYFITKEENKDHIAFTGEKPKKKDEAKD